MGREIQKIWLLTRSHMHKLTKPLNSCYHCSLNLYLSLSYNTFPSQFTDGKARTASTPQILTFLLLLQKSARPHKQYQKKKSHFLAQELQGELHRQLHSWDLFPAPGRSRSLDLEKIKLDLWLSLPPVLRHGGNTENAINLKTETCEESQRIPKAALPA